ncbi:MAG: GcrA family cell cycle regulator [Alphaproteobacteria bacterium]|nr:GcrA family cell cycle regulator [Alphaproteobacteria bacterium]
MQWTEQRINLLKDLWGQGKSASQIARILGEGLTRNAVIGKVHRLGLASRPTVSSSPQSIPKIPEKKPVVVEKNTVKKKVKPSSTLSVSVAPPIVQRTCMWPIGDPKQSDFQFCGQVVEVGKPYCSEHCNIAYHRRMDSNT